MVVKAGGKAAIISQAHTRLKTLGQKVSVLTVKGPAGAMVHIDGKAVGVVPVEVVILPGSHRIALIKSKQVVGRQTVTLKGGQPETITVIAPVPIAPPPRKRRVGSGTGSGTGTGHAVGPNPTPRPKGLPMTYALTFAVVAVALAGAATGTGVKALQLHKEWKDTGSSSTRKSGMLLQNVTNVLWGVSGAAAVTAAILAIFTRWKRTKPDRYGSATLDVDVDVGPLPGGASVTLSTRF